MPSPYKSQYLKKLYVDYCIGPHTCNDKKLLEQECFSPCPWPTFQLQQHMQDEAEEILKKSCLITSKHKQVSPTFDLGCTSPDRLDLLIVLAPEYQVDISSRP